MAEGSLCWKSQKSTVKILAKKIKYEHKKDEHKYQKMAYNLVRKALKNPKFIKNPTAFYQNLMQARGTHEVFMWPCDPGLSILKTILLPIL